MCIRDRGMCVDWSIHDKGDGNPHVHLLVTMRPFNLDHSWGAIKPSGFSNLAGGRAETCHKAEAGFVDGTAYK